MGLRSLVRVSMVSAAMEHQVTMSSNRYKGAHTYIDSFISMGP